ncbi:MAG TPA: AAA family ATPase [Terriglobia bacterium]|nr:AAA family ATPase [Terriglobia bacterium]
MKIKQLTIHNFRSLSDLTLAMEGYSLLVGQNNAGKTSILTALRCFYEEGGAKFDRRTDFPKFPVGDKDSWIEIHFQTSSEEDEDLKEEYRSSDRTLRVRRYFASEDDDLAKAGQSNIFGYENGKLSENLFYGAKNISQAKLGSAIYIPEVSKTEDALKLTGPSPLRGMINFVMKRAVSESESFSNLRKAFEQFDEAFKEESSKDGFSVRLLVEEINKSIGHWGIRFGVDVNPLQPEEVVRSLLAHYIEDENLGNERVSVSSYGQGLQRDLIYTLIRLSTKFVAPPKAKRKKEFNPDFTLILFEEPEAFMHPSQQGRLSASLRALSCEPDQQVVVTTHSPHFVSRQIREFTSIVRLEKAKESTVRYQLADRDIEELMDENLGLYKTLCEKLEDDTVPVEIKNKIRNNYVDADMASKLEEEAVQYLLWLNSERCSLFFASHVVICEGPSEKVLFEYLISQEWPTFRNRNVYFADALGKFNIHRHIALLSRLGIPHSVLVDRDGDADVHAIVNQFIEDRRTSLTTVVKWFDQDLESLLGIPKPKRAHLKPINALARLCSGKIEAGKVQQLKSILEEMIRGV